MEKSTLFTNPVIWTFILFASAYLLYLYNKNKKGGEEKPNPINLFPLVQRRPSNIRHIPYQYVHIGLKCEKRSEAQIKLDISGRRDTEELRGMDYLSHHCIEYKVESCECGKASPIFVDIISLSGQELHTEDGTTPVTTISSPTGTVTPVVRDAMGLNILSDNQYIHVDNVLRYAHHLSDEHINDSVKSENPFKIALIDTGLDRNCKSHTFLSGALEVCEKFNSPDIDGHGTFVYYFTKVGLAKRGITNYEIYPYNVADCSGNIVLGNALCAIIDAAEKGINTINLSFGFYDHLPLLESFFCLLFETYPNVKVVCSVGNIQTEVVPFSNPTIPINETNQCAHPPSYYHNTYNNLFQITAVQFENNTNALIPCEFTNFENLANLACQGFFRMMLNGQECEFGGTSFAAPFFAGYYSDLNPLATYTAMNNLLNNNPQFGQVGRHIFSIDPTHFLPNDF